MSPWWWLLWVACRPSGEVGPSTPSAGDTVVSSSPGATADSGPVRDTGPWADPWVCGEDVDPAAGILVSVAVKTDDDDVILSLSARSRDLPNETLREPLHDAGFEGCARETYFQGGTSVPHDGGVAELTVGEQVIPLEYVDGTSLSAEGYASFRQSTTHPDFDWADWLDQPVTFRLEGSGEVPPIETMWVGRTALAAVEVMSPEEFVEVDPAVLTYRWAPGASPTGRVMVRWSHHESLATVVCDVEDTGSWAPPPSVVDQLVAGEGVGFELWSAPPCAKAVAPGLQLSTNVRHAARNTVYVQPPEPP